jgi:hypothetical protein
VSEAIRFEPGIGIPLGLRQALEASHDVLDRAEILRRTAVSLRKQAKDLDDLANRIDPTDLSACIPEGRE